MTTQQTTVKERPILFSGPMVRAILDGRKTQTRRVMKPQPEYRAKRKLQWSWGTRQWLNGHTPTDHCKHCSMWNSENPYGQPVDRLWVRETFAVCADNNIFYKADGKPDPWDGIKWKPSIHMPRKASRITLEITGVRVERLQDISPTEACKEGIFEDGNYCSEPPLPYPVATFKKLWNSINGPGSWVANPWVWVIEFKKL